MIPTEIASVPTHPMLVHFPIAFFFGALIFSLVALGSRIPLYRELVFWNLLLAVLFSIPTALAGLQQYNTIAHNQQIHHLMKEHMVINLSVVGLMVVLTPWSWGRRYGASTLGTTVFVLLMLAGTAAFSYSAFLGKKMVYQLGAAVAPMQQEIRQQGGHGHGGSGEAGSGSGKEGRSGSHGSHGHSGAGEHGH